MDGKTANLKLINEIRMYYEKGNEHLQLPFNYADDKYAKRIGTGDYFWTNETMPEMGIYDQYIMPTEQEGVFYCVYRKCTGEFVTFHRGIRRVRGEMLARMVPAMRDYATDTNIFVYFKYEVYDVETGEGTMSIHDFVAYMKYNCVDAWSKK